MGRYYSGDIQGKFWVAVQESDDASFFGGHESEPSYIEYYFDENDLEDIKEGIEKCKKALGKNIDQLDEFFRKNEYYNDKELAVYLGMDTGKEEAKSIYTSQLNEMLTWYARLILGKKILKCVEKNGQCSFEAEI